MTSLLLILREAETQARELRRERPDDRVVRALHEKINEAKRLAGQVN